MLAPTRISHFRNGAAAAVFLAVALGNAQSTVKSARTPVADSLIPALAQSQALARVAAATPIQVTVSLDPRDAAGLASYADAVSNPASSLYRHFLTPSQVGDKFGATTAVRQSMATYLASKGLAVTLVAPNGLAIIAQGTASAVESAFSTKLNVYSGTDAITKAPITYRANATEAQLPAELASHVINVSGLETYSRPKPRVSTLTPAQFTTLYGLTNAYNANFLGQGRNIAISSFDGFKLSNVPLYTRQFNLPVPSGGSGSNVSVVTVGTGAQNTTPQGEGDLDIQQVLGAAPLANVRIYDSANDLIGVLTRESSDNWADIVTESYGWGLSTSTAQSAHNLHLAMTAQGITYSCASGDDGTSIGTYSYPDFDPEVLQVGGTIATTSTAGARQSETGWSGSGGGWVNNTSTFNVLPTWQKGTGVPTNVNRRLVPDIGLHASGQTGAGAYYVEYNGKLYSFSGTSCASPLFAASLAVVEQRLANGSTASHRLGRLQDTIYAQNGRSDVYYDVTSGSNGKLPKNTTSNTLNGPTSSCTKGWDYVTGWGAINFDALYNTFVTSARP